MCVHVQFRMQHIRAQRAWRTWSQGGRVIAVAASHDRENGEILAASDAIAKINWGQTSLFGQQQQQQQQH